MNIKNFLIDNYIWILAIILITIITIIGFLADKKKNDSKNQQPQQPPMPSANEMNNQTPMQYQNNTQMPINQMNQQSQIGIQPNDTNQMVQMSNVQTNPTMLEQSMPQNQQPIVAENQQSNIMENNNNPQQIENIVPTVKPEPMYQPLSEQKPVIAPKPIPDYPNTQIITEQPMKNQLNTTNLNNMQSMSQEMTMPHMAAPTIQQQPQPMSPYNSQPTTPMQNNNGINTNVVPNIGTMPQPINSIPTPIQTVPQQVVPQHIMSQNQPQPMPTYNMGQQMQPNMVNSMPQQNMHPTNQMPTNQAPINFVFGPQSNNQNM